MNHLISAVADAIAQQRRPLNCREFQKQDRGRRLLQRMFRLG